MGTIREAMDRAIDRRALAPAAKVFDLDHVGMLEKIVLPLGPIAGQLADAFSTREALASGGFVEGNPAVRRVVNRMPLFFALKVGVGALMAISVKRLQDGGHANAARVASAIGTLAGAGPALSNLRLMQRI